MGSTINIFDMFTKMVNNNILLIYHGAFDQDMIKSVLVMTEKKLTQEKVEENLKRKVFNIMMEGLQNIAKHQIIINEEQFPFLLISHEAESYNVITGNYVHHSKISIITSKIDLVNSMNKDELKEHYKQARLQSVISEVGGAGLGFIDMARKSGNKIGYKFYDISPEHSLFIQHNKINKN